MISYLVRVVLYVRTGFGRDEDQDIILRVLVSYDTDVQRYQVSNYKSCSRTAVFRSIYRARGHKTNRKNEKNLLYLVHISYVNSWNPVILCLLLRAW